MNNLFNYISAENYKFFKSNLWKFSILIATLVSIFIISSIPKSTDWKNQLNKSNEQISLELNMTHDELNQSIENNDLIKKWKENNAYLESNNKPAMDDTIQGYLSKAMSLKGLGLILVVFTVIFGSSMAKEFESGTIKFMMINPNSRIKIIIGKYCSIIFTSFAFLASIFIINFIIVLLFMDKSGPVYFKYESGKIAEYNIYYFVLKNVIVSLFYYASYITLAFMLAILLKSTSLSLSISLVFALLGTQVINLFSISTTIKKYLLPAIVDLTYYSENRVLFEQGGYLFFFYVSIILTYIAIFLLISIIHFKNSEI